VALTEILKRQRSALLAAFVDPARINKRRCSQARNTWLHTDVLFTPAVARTAGDAIGYAAAPDRCGNTQLGRGKWQV